MALVEFAGYPPSRMPGKAVYGEVSHQRHSVTKLPGLLSEKLHVLQRPVVAREAILVAEVDPGETLCAAAK